MTISSEQIEAAITAYDEQKRSELKAKHGYVTDVPLSETGRAFLRPAITAALIAADAIRTKPYRSGSEKVTIILGVIGTLVAGTIALDHALTLMGY